METKSVLYVEDDADDREILADAIRHVDAGMDVVFADNGMSALDYLYQLKKEKKSFPNLIILDLNLPYLDGKQTFIRIQEDPDLKNLPLVIFTSSENPNDRALFQRYGVELITKPDLITHFRDAAQRMLKHYS